MLRSILLLKIGFPTRKSDATSLRAHITDWDSLVGRLDVKVVLPTPWKEKRC